MSYNVCKEIDTGKTFYYTIPETLADVKSFMRLPGGIVNIESGGWLNGISISGVRAKTMEKCGVSISFKSPINEQYVIVNTETREIDTVYKQWFGTHFEIVSPDK